MDLALSHCYVTVHDPEQALAFYRDALGLELRSDVAAGEYRWVTLSPPEQPELEIVLVETHAGRPATDGDAMLELVTKGSLHGLIFRTANLDATFEKVRASGAEVLQEPLDQHWGVRDCAFRDPSGNLIRIAQAPAN